MMNKLHQTTTSVHNQQEQVQQRKRVEKNGEGTLLMLVIYAQLLLALCYGLFAYIGTTAWQSVVLSAPIAIGLLYLGRLVAARGVVRWVFLLVVPALLLDMLLFLLGICDLTFDFILPSNRRFVNALLVCAFVLVTLLSSGDSALARLARALFPLLLAALIWSTITCMLNVRIGNLTPVLGKGIQSTLLSTLLTAGSVWQTPLPIILDKEKGNSAPRSPKFVLFGILVAALTALSIASLWPLEAILRPLAPSKRMMLLNEASASTLTWSLLVFSWLFLLLISLGASARSLQHVMMSVFPLKKAKWVFLLVPFLLVLLPATLATDELIDWVLKISPLRLGLILLALLLSLILSGRKKKCEEKG